MNLCDELKDSLQKIITNWKEPIEVEKRVVVALFTLMSGSTIKLVSHLFGIGQSTIYEILTGFIKTVNCKLSYKLDWHRLDKLKRIAIEFQAQKGLAHFLGPLDGVHILINPPRRSLRREDYINKKGFRSVIMQAIVDHECCFTYIHAGLLGCNHDS